MAFFSVGILYYAAAELGRNPVSKHQIQPEYGDEQADGTGLPNPSRETKFSGANADREKNFFAVQLTTSRIGNLTRLILPLTYGMAIHIHTYYDQYIQQGNLKNCKAFKYCSACFSNRNQ